MATGTDKTDINQHLGDSSTDHTKKHFRRNAILGVIGFALLVLVTSVCVNLWFKGEEGSNLYYSLATGLIISWMIVLVAYYIWAMQFYNVNHGWSMAAWKRHEVKAVDDPSAKEQAPKGNPHQSETLGLPNGTIRGTIAVSLLVGGLAMMIASMGMKSKLEANSFFIDNFDFFKTAFLMMIAFYFGNKSLDFLKNPRKVVATGDGAAPASPEPQKADPDFEDKNANG
mgnify:CR=1 FL=1